MQNYMQITKIYRKIFTKCHTITHKNKKYIQLRKFLEKILILYIIKKLTDIVSEYIIFEYVRLRLL